MEIYTSEHDQVEALQKFWQKHGTKILGGIVLLIALVVGWRAWMGQQQREAESASAVYQQMLEATGRDDELLAKGRQVVAEYPDTSYAALASLQMAGVEVKQNKLDEATAHLRWVMDHGKGDVLRTIARVRLARVLLAKGEAQQALDLLPEGNGAGMEGVYQEARGDALLALGKRSEARGAYAKALEAYGEVPEKQALLKMKIDDLADAGGKAG